MFSAIIIRKSQQQNHLRYLPYTNDRITQIYTLHADICEQQTNLWRDVRTTYIHTRQPYHPTHTHTHTVPLDQQLADIVNKHYANTYHLPHHPDNRRILKQLHKLHIDPNVDPPSTPPISHFCSLLQQPRSTMRSNRAGGDEHSHARQYNIVNSYVNTG